MNDPVPAASPPLRLFVALWPGPRTRAALAAWRDGWRWPPGARPVADDKLHLTLHFLGAVAPARLPALLAALDVPAARFTLALGAAEVWRGGVAVLRPLAEAPALVRLHARLAGAIAMVGFVPEPRTFRPHVTLARHAAGATPGLRPPALAWRVQGHALVQSDPDGRYRVLRRYPARGDTGA